MKKFLVLSSILLAGCGNGYEYGQGFQNGSLQKLSKHGMFCKTWEGTMIMGGIRRSSQSPITNFWEFTIKDDAVASKLSKLAENCQNIRFSYSDRALSSVCSGDTAYFVNDVQCEVSQ